MPPHYAFWPSRLPHAITTPATSLWFNIVVNAQRYPDKAALIFMGRALSYRQLHDDAERLAAQLALWGVGKGDRVLLCMQNCTQWVVAHFAILRANAVVVPVNPMNRALELVHYIEDSGARVAITTGDLAGEMADASGQLTENLRLSHLLVSQYTDAFDPQALEPGDMPQAWKEWLCTPRALPVLAGGQVHRWNEALASTGTASTHLVGPDDLAVLPYTSGTTGLPKGCMHPHRTLMHNAVASSLWGTASADGVALCVVPMFHITGMVSVMHAALYSGSTLVLMPRWDRDLAGRLISHYKVTVWTNIPTMIIDLMASPNFAQFDLTSLKSIGGGGAAMPQAIAQRLQDQYGLKYAEGYGLTETAAPSHSNPLDRPKQQCLGIPFMGTDARIVDPQTLKERPQGEQGEIVVSGPEVFDGYWKHPEATEAAFFELDGKRFFRTGDLGRVDEDGYFFITDRLKRMINASGYKVWPAEVEMMMYRHPAIQEVCIISAHDDYRGQTVKAVVVLRPGQEGQVSGEDIMAWCRERMAVYKAPHQVQFTDRLPKSGSGKVMWRHLQEAQDSGRL